MNSVGNSKKKEKVQSEKGKFKFLISLILACVVAVGLIKYEEYSLSKFDTESVICVSDSTATLQEGTVITKENAAKYFVTKEIPKNMVTKNTLKTVDDIIGKKTSVEMYANCIITAAQFADVNEKLSEIENPVETSINATDLSQVVGGILREGDTIDISIIGEENNLVYELKDVYVTKAFNASGELIEKNSNASGDESVSNENAMVVNVIISKADEEELNQNLKNGQVRVAKTNDVVR